MRASGPSIAWAGLLALALGGLVSCGPSRTQGGYVISWDRQSWTVSPWRADASHEALARGRLLRGESPVAGALLEVAGRRRLVTGKDGGFELRVDRSLPRLITVRVLEPASARGTEGDLRVSYPVEILGVKGIPGLPAMVEVEARAASPGDFPVVRVEDWSVEGRVAKADGSPAPGAVVGFVELGGEGWAASSPADGQGSYRLFLTPENDTDLALKVVFGGQTYALPGSRVFHLPDQRSARIDITLPASGTTIADRPPALVSRSLPGRRYLAMVIAPERAKGGGAFHVSLPDSTGRFILRMERAEWDKGPAWVEGEFRLYREDTIAPGTFITSEDLAAAQALGP